MIDILSSVVVGVRDTSEVGERDCESLPRVVKSREPLRRRRKTKKRKKPKRGRRGRWLQERQRRIRGSGRATVFTLDGR